MSVLFHQAIFWAAGMLVGIGIGWGIARRLAARPQVQEPVSPQGSAPVGGAWAPGVALARDEHPAAVSSKAA